MKRIVMLVAIVAISLVSTGAFAADRAAIQKNVDGVIKELNAGKKASAFTATDYSPYVFIMEKNGTLLAHPSLTGKDLKSVALPVYEALVKATSAGVWVDYTWKGKEKHSYVKIAKNGLISGSGY